MITHNPLGIYAVTVPHKVHRKYNTRYVFIPRHNKSKVYPRIPEYNSKVRQHIYDLYVDGDLMAENVSLSLVSELRNIPGAKRSHLKFTI